MVSTYTTRPVPIGSLKHGDTVIHNGQMLTVSASNLKRGGFMGTTLAGDSYHAGHKPVTLVEFKTHP